MEDELSVQNFKDRFTEIFDRVVDGEAFTIAREGGPVAVLIPYDEYLLLYPFREES